MARMQIIQLLACLTVPLYRKARVWRLDLSLTGRPLALMFLRLHFVCEVRNVNKLPLGQFLQAAGLFDISGLFLPSNGCLILLLRVVDFNRSLKNHMLEYLQVEVDTYLTSTFSPFTCFASTGLLPSPSI
jgi:hypothetical protein